MSEIFEVVVYNKATGQIYSSGTTCSPELLETDTKGVLIGQLCDVMTCYVDNKNVVTMLPKPDEHHIFDYDSKKWLDPRTYETEWVLVRKKRNELLQSSDWTQLPDVPLITKEAWSNYRQELRNITIQPNPFNIVWPEAP